MKIEGKCEECNKRAAIVGFGESKKKLCQQCFEEALKAVKAVRALEAPR